MVEGPSPLGCDAVSIAKYLPTFRRRRLPSYSGQPKNLKVVQELVGVFRIWKQENSSKFSDFYDYLYIYIALYAKRLKPSSKSHDT
jgi:hypothetical protein